MKLTINNQLYERGAPLYWSRRSFYVFVEKYKHEITRHCRQVLGLRKRHSFKNKLFGETDYEITFFKTFINKLSQKNSSIDLLNGEEKKVLIASNVVDLQHHNVVETTDIFKAFAAYFCSFSTLLPQLHGRYQLINLAQLWACWRLIASRRDNKK